MLLSRAEMSHDFGGARLDPIHDRELLAWIFSQFLYGEVTGIQVGRWIERAPDIDAASFFARQATEEFSHVRVFLEILEILGVPPAPASRIVRILATDLTGRTFEEHVAIEMAQGEGLVLTAIYALADTVDHPRIAALLEATARQEERHVAFGEERTLRAVESRPRLARHLLGLALLGLTVLERLEGSLRRIGTRTPDDGARDPLDRGADAGPRADGSSGPATRPVRSQLDAFCRTARAGAELRLRRLGLLDRPLSQIGATTRLALIGRSLARSALSSPFRRSPRLTRTYLEDPLVRARKGPGAGIES